jgi:chromosomal replication initiator protein
MITVRDIQDAVCAKYEFTRDEFMQPDSSIKYAHPRQVAMYLAKEITRLSWKELGRLFCRDHSTICNAYGKVKLRLAHDPYVRLAVNELTADLFAANAKNSPMLTEDAMRKAWGAQAKLTRVSGSAV